MDQQLNIGFDQTTPVVCDSCGHMYFEQALHIRRVSGILTGTGSPSFMPIPVFSCKSCGHINTEFLPKEMNTVDDDGDRSGKVEVQ
jgi:rubredoxin